MKKLIICLLVFSAGNPIFGQRIIAIEINAGVAIPTHSDLNKVFHAGVNGSIGLPLNVLKQKLYLKPTVGGKLYTKKIDKSNSISENIRIWKAGLELQYFLVGNEHVQMLSTLRVDFNLLDNYNSKSGYDPITKTSTAITSDHYLTGKSGSLDVGCLIRVRNINIKVDYEFYSPKLKVLDEIVDNAYRQGYYIPSSKSLNCNSLNISVGYTLWFK